MTQKLGWLKIRYYRRNQRERNLFLALLCGPSVLVLFGKTQCGLNPASLPCLKNMIRPRQLPFIDFQDAVAGFCRWMVRYASSS